MPTIRPIPKKLLIHTVQYQEFLENGDGWGNGYAEPVPIENVRVEAATSLNRSANSDEVIASHILILDRGHSNPFQKMKQKDKVTFDGADWEVHKVNPFYGFGSTPHHYEVELK